MRRLCLAFWIALWGSAAAHAQTAPEPVSITESGQAYLDSLRFKRVQTDVGYFDPTAPAPEMTTREQPRPKRSPNDTVDMPDIVTILAALFLAWLAYMLLRHGRGSSLSLSRVRNASRQSGQRVPRQGPDDEIPASLADIQRTKDRRLGVVLLARRALALATERNGVLLQRSWTARDAMRHIPQDQPHRSALQALVGTSEAVQFGNRDISEEEFQKHLTDTLPLMRGQPA